MRTLLFGALATAALLQAPPTHPSPSAASVVLSGRVVTGSGPNTRPVRHARVTLSGGSLTIARITDTDTKGEYRFERLAKAEYRVAVQKPGFVTLEEDAASSVTLTMVRGAAIEGVVTDQNGNPVVNAPVSAVQRQPNGATRNAAQTRTDDLGRYRLHSLPAADYLIKAAVDREFIVMTAQAVGGYPQDGELSRTTSAYYPATPAIEDAKPIHVSPGSNTSGIDVSLTLELLAVDPEKRPLQTPQHPPGTGVISGRLTETGSGKPIMRARVELVSLGDVRNGRIAITDSKGQFRFPGLAPQTYTIRADATGFVAAAYGRTRPGQAGLPIDVPADQAIAADMSLQRTSAVEGTLTDEFGDPAPGIFLQLAQRVSIAGRRLMEPAGGVPQPTDDRGHYRVSGLEPGDYYAAALSGPFVAVSRQPGFGEGDPVASQNGVGGFATTWYPGTSDVMGGLPISVASGADNVNVSFALVPARTVSVSGTLIGPDGLPVNGGDFLLRPSARPDGPGFIFGRGKTSADGHFALRNVPQGTYTLQGRSLGEPGPKSGGQQDVNLLFPFGSMPVDVGDVDVDGLVLKVTRGATLSGKIVLEDANGAAPSPQQVLIRPMPTELGDIRMQGDSMFASETHDDWTFAVSHLYGHQHIVVGVNSPMWMLKRITRGGIDITDDAVDFSDKDVADVEVVLTSKVTRVTGVVSDDKGLASDFAVVIFPSDPTKWTLELPFPRRIVLARRARQSGFEARALPPDDYLAVALPSVGEIEWVDPEFLQAIRPLATAFTLQEGESKTLELRLKVKP